MAEDRLALTSSMFVPLVPTVVKPNLMVPRQEVSSIKQSNLPPQVPSSVERGQNELIENASHITGIAIERHMKEQALQRERDQLRLLLEITKSVTPASIGQPPNTAFLVAVEYFVTGLARDTELPAELGHRLAS
jgi:3-deoxy-D-arabino-heptulosonate 7-phosphate (DAHP) synthase